MFHNQPVYVCVVVCVCVFFLKICSYLGSACDTDTLGSSLQIRINSMFPRFLFLGHFNQLHPQRAVVYLSPATLSRRRPVAGH